MDSRLGNYSSYTWKSIWEAKGLVQVGLQWQVGTRENMSHPKIGPKSFEAILGILAYMYSKFHEFGNL